MVLEFEGVVASDKLAHGMARIAAISKIGDRKKERFTITLCSISNQNRHPIMDQLEGKRVRIVIQDI